MNLYKNAASDWGSWLFFFRLFWAPRELHGFWELPSSAKVAPEYQALLALRSCAYEPRILCQLRITMNCSWITPSSHFEGALRSFAIKLQLKGTRAACSMYTTTRGCSRSKHRSHCMFTKDLSFPLAQGKKKPEPAIIGGKDNGFL